MAALGESDDLKGYPSLVRASDPSCPVDELQIFTEGTGQRLGSLARGHERTQLWNDFRLSTTGCLLGSVFTSYSIVVAFSRAAFSAFVHQSKSSIDPLATASSSVRYEETSSPRKCAYSAAMGM